MRWTQIEQSSTSGPPAALARAVRAEAEVSIIIPGFDAIGAKLDKLGEGFVRISGHPKDLTNVKPGDPASVSFQHDGRVMIFMSVVTSEPQAGRVKMDMPRSVYAELRRHRRIRVGPYSDLVVRARVSERDEQPWIGDLSLGGARLCWDDQAPDWQRSTLVRLDLQLQQESVSVVGMVVRAEAQALGIRFQPMAEDSSEHKGLSRLLARLDREKKASS